MSNSYRLNELIVFIYRLLLAFVFLFLSRFLFLLFHQDLLQISGASEITYLLKSGLVFDRIEVLYLNIPFIIFSVFPLAINTKPYFQKFLLILYFICNILGFALNFIDIAYFPFSMSRLTTSSFDVIQHETNKMSLLSNFTKEFWGLLLLFAGLCLLWIYLYKKVKLKDDKIRHWIWYFGLSIPSFIGIITLVIGGIRGDFKHSTRPLNITDANNAIKNPLHADAILNTPFTIIRTIGTGFFKKVDFLSEHEANRRAFPFKQYPAHSNSKKKNVVIFIIESFGKEYLGAFNQNNGIENYQSHTPFIDSLANHSLIFSNAYANGRKSIHGMSSVLAGIPSFESAYTSSAFVSQKLNSLVSNLNDYGYQTSFFHGSSNGSMGFLGFSNILGFDRYFGKTEYNKDEDYDGIWGIWDEPFLQYMSTEVSKMKEPFMATVFTVSSHDPFKIPEKYANRFPEGKIPMHKCVEYTDYSIQQFFEKSKSEPWFKNTLFVITADHTNQIFYPEYLKPLNRFAIPILFYDPAMEQIGGEKLIGENKDLAQQIDIYPTILDYIGYPKVFRSWGRSLISEQNQKPFVITSNSKVFYYIQGSYICLFDGKKAIGFYKADDLGLENNLIANKNEQMLEIELNCKAFIQDYMERIMERKLDKVE